VEPVVGASRGAPTAASMITRFVGVLRHNPAMAYDEDLAARVHAAIEGEPGLTRKAMFGGLAFLINGNLAVSASGQGGLLLRVDPAKTESFVDEPLVRRFEMRGREMNGWLRVDPDAVDSDAALRRWAAIGVAYARSLPPKR
jgi:hypothetical protein